MLTAELIPIFSDNYVFLIIDSETKEALVVDPGQASETIQVLKARKLKLKSILITHHHADHIDGIRELKEEFQAEVFAPIKNKSQIPFVDHWVQNNSQIESGNFKMQVMELPGHTLGHIGYYFKNENWLFSGDVLFGLGCGRLFEGSFEQMFQTLQKIKALPPETQVFCAHEYTETNLRFCESLMSGSETAAALHLDHLKQYASRLMQKRRENKPSVPLALADEINTNPFLLAKSVDQFTTIRQLRNVF